MLQELRIKNFLSYADEIVTFSAETIAVVGENGHGKSGLLEAILFALFGIGRNDLQKLIRIGSSGEMSVRIALFDVPSKGKRSEIERGIKESGAGYTKVWINDKLMASGGAKPSPNKAQEFIDTLLGSDSDTFMLTNFFGLGANDSLMQVRPSERLETLQKLAGVTICARFHDLANGYSTSFANMAEKERYVVENIPVEDEKQLNKEYTAISEEYTAIKAQIDSLLSRRTELLKDEDRFRGLTTERETIRAKRETLLKQKDREERTLQREKQDWEDAKHSSESLSLKRKTLEQSLSKMRTMKEIKREYDEQQTKKIELESAVALRNTALAGSDRSSSNCPLCDNLVDKDVQTKWAKEIENLSKNIAITKTILRDRKMEADNRKSIDEEFESIKDRLESLTKEGTKAELNTHAAEKELERVNNEIDKIESRFIALKREMSGYEEVVSEMKSIDSKMNEAQNKSGKKEQEIIQKKKQIETCVENNNKLKKSKKNIEEYSSKARCCKIVADAFSRYSIPVRLLGNLRKAIEKRASIIYRSFNGGVIQIRDVEGAKPGVEFVLIDSGGERDYKSLSVGEKVMVFLSIRIALTQIIGASRRSSVDFLILDEVAGNLSPTMRDSLTRLINILLRKFFPQIFMVSHVELKDIFNKTLLIEKKDGISHII